MKYLVLLLTILVGFSVTVQGDNKKAIYPSLTQENLGAMTDYRQSGGHDFTVSTDAFRSDYGCKIRYTVFMPVQIVGSNLLETETERVMVILGHGFFRSQKNQKAMAEHVASWGVPITTVDFCNSRPWNGHHDRNGEDMVKVADRLNVSKVIYAGFSAGGLASFIAASLDGRTQAYLGLDMVDNFKKGQKAASNMKPSVFGFVAKRSACNAKNNGLDVYRGLQEAPQVLGIAGASHCDFEFPFDKKCSFACGRNKKPYERKDIQSTILGLTTALFVWQSGVDESAQQWWDVNQSVQQTLLEQDRIRFVIK